MDDDVPLTVDFRDLATARAWADEAEVKRPWRRELRAAIADCVREHQPAAMRVLELGPGPGLLAEHLLASCAIARYTLLDFSQPFLDMARERLGERSNVHYVVGDFTRDDWTRLVEPGVDAIVAMQAAHEIRHKRHLPRLYGAARSLVRPGGLVVICDHEPVDDSAKQQALCATEAEQHAALGAAGLEPATRARLRGMYVVTGCAPDAR